MAPKLIDQEEQERPTLSKLESACAELKAFLRASENEGDNLRKTETRLDVVDGTLSSASARVIPLHSLSMSTKALDSRINRAVYPAFSLLESFKLSESLQRTLLEISSQLSSDENRVSQKRLQKVLQFVNCVDNLGEAIDSICEEGEPVIQRIQEAVEFVSRTKIAEERRAQRLREALVALKALYETQVDAMKFEGILDEALLRLQDEFESLLLKLRHSNFQNLDDTPPHKRCDSDTDDHDTVASELGSELQIEVLRRISETLAVNDCVDICICIYIKVRYRRVAKTLMKLNPEYLRTYNPEGIDAMEWESLETAITLWIQHFKLAVKNVLSSEKRLCRKVFGHVLDEVVWEECFARIADKIMAVFFRFGEGVARSSKEPQKLFKLLDMLDSLEKLSPKIRATFDGEAGIDICARFRELEKLIIDASSKTLWEFGLQIEGNILDSFQSPEDGSVPKLVRYTIGYLKCLATPNYRTTMARVLQTEQMWNGRTSSQPGKFGDLLVDAISDILDALQRYIESKRSHFRDSILIHVFTMNACWYIYMRTKNTELADLMGEQYMKTKFKLAAEEAAYVYQKHAWGALVTILDLEGEETQGKDRLRGLMAEKVETFLKDLDDSCRRHKSLYSIPDVELREQMREAALKAVVPAYAEFLELWSVVMFRRKHYPGAETVRGIVSTAFDFDNLRLKHRSSNNRTMGGPSPLSSSLETGRSESRSGISDGSSFRSNTSSHAHV